MNLALCLCQTGKICRLPCMVQHAARQHKHRCVETLQQLLNLVGTFLLGGGARHVARSSKNLHKHVQRRWVSNKEYFAEACVYFIRMSVCIIYHISNYLYLWRFWVCRYVCMYELCSQLFVRIGSVLQHDL